MLAASLLTTFLLALVVAAHPVVQSSPFKSVPLVKRINPQAGPYNIVQRDQQRIRSLKARAEGLEARDGITSTPATNQAVSYIASVDVGSPATQYNLIVDTGSSNTWVGASKPYTPTSTSRITNDTVLVVYGSGAFVGTEVIDQVNLGNGLVIKQQSIGVARASRGFSGVDGILGLGPVDLTNGTLAPDTKSTIPTVTHNLFNSSVIGAEILGVYFQPTTSLSSTNGELSWGGPNSIKYTGEITYTPITKVSPANEYWGIDAFATYGAETPILDSTAGIVDTGTTLVLLATQAFNAYQKATGGVPDSATGLLKITSAQFANLQSLFFTIAGTSFELTANAQIWPRSLNTDIGGTADDIYLIVASLGTPTGQGLDFIVGQTFLERFYSVFDTDNQRVGLATTPFTKATSN